MTNLEIVMTNVSLLGLDIDANMYRETLDTVASWNRKGYKVKKGEKALFTCKIWKPKTKKDIERERQKAIDNGVEYKNNNRMKLVNSAFFNMAQVEPMPQKAGK